MKEVVIVSGKGGSGKTTISASFCALANDVIAVDTDVEASNMKFLLLGNNSSDPSIQIPFFGMKKAKIDPITCLNCGECAAACRFDAIIEKNGIHTVINSNCEGCTTCKIVCPENAITMIDHQIGEILQFNENSKLSFVYADLDIGEDGSGKLVAEVRNLAHKMNVDKSKSWIIIDGPPGIGCPVISSISGTDFAVIVVEASVSGFKDFIRIKELVEAFNIPLGVIINRYSHNIEITKEISKYCETEKIPILAQVPFDSHCLDALSAGVSIVEFDKKSPASIKIKQAWKNLNKLVN